MQPPREPYGSRGGLFKFRLNGQSLGFVEKPRLCLSVALARLVRAYSPL